MLTSLILVLAAPGPTSGGTRLFPLWISIPIFLLILGFVLYRKFSGRQK